MPHYNTLLAVAMAITTIVPAYAMEVVAGGQRNNANLESKLSSKLATLSAIVKALGQEVGAIRNCSIRGEYYDSTNRDCKTSTLGTQVSVNEGQIVGINAQIDAAAACNKNDKSYNWETGACNTSTGVNVRKVTNVQKKWRFPATTAQCDSSEIIVGGGGSCHAPKGYTYLRKNMPYNNGWFVSCDNFSVHQNVTATAYALCMKK